MMKRPVKPDGLYIVALLVVSTAVFMLYILLATQNHFSQLEPLLSGTAPRPYMYRVLAPLLVRLVSYGTSTSPFLAAFLVMYGSMIGFSISMLALASLFLPSPYFKTCALLAPVGLIPFLFEQRHVYDFPVLFLFTLALYFLAKNGFSKYVTVFILATFAKETSLFLILFFVIQFRTIERKKFVFLLFVQMAAYTLIRVVLIYLFRNNPGSVVEFHLYDHWNAYLHHPVQTVILLSAIILIMGMSMGSSADPSGFVRNSLVAIGGPTLLLYFFFGVPFEVRIFFETYPSLYLSLCFAGISLIHRFAS